jgi:hypothetical protein
MIGATFLLAAEPLSEYMRLLTELGADAFLTNNDGSTLMGPPVWDSGSGRRSGHRRSA